MANASKFKLSATTDRTARTVAEELALLAAEEAEAADEAANAAWEAEKMWLEATREELPRRFKLGYGVQLHGPWGEGVEKAPDWFLKWVNMLPTSVSNMLYGTRLAFELGFIAQTFPNPIELAERIEKIRTAAGKSILDTNIWWGLLAAPTDEATAEAIALWGNDYRCKYVGVRNAPHDFRFNPECGRWEAKVSWQYRQGATTQFGGGWEAADDDVKNILAYKQQQETAAA